MTIDVNRMSKGIHEDWYYTRDEIDNIPKTWNKGKKDDDLDLPAILWIQTNAHEYTVICHENRYGVSPYKLIRYKYKERRNE